MYRLLVQNSEPWADPDRQAIAFHGGTAAIGVCVCVCVCECVCVCMCELEADIFSWDSHRMGVNLRIHHVNGTGRESE